MTWVVASLSFTAIGFWRVAKGTEEREGWKAVQLWFRTEDKIAAISLVSISLAHWLFIFDM